MLVGALSGRVVVIVAATPEITAMLVDAMRGLPPVGQQLAA
jgi:hypothetical protein